MMFVCYLCVVSIILGVVSAGVARWVPVKQMQMGQMAHKASGDLLMSCQWKPRPRDRWLPQKSDRSEAIRSSFLECGRVMSDALPPRISDGDALFSIDFGTVRLVGQRIVWSSQTWTPLFSS